MLCTVAVQANGLAIEFVNIEYLTTELIVAAVTQCGHAINLVPNQTLELCKLAIKQSAYAIVCVADQTEELCMMAIDTPFVLKYINNPSSLCVTTAVELDGLTLEFVTNQTEELCLLAV